MPSAGMNVKVSCPFRPFVKPVRIITGITNTAAALFARLLFCIEAKCNTLHEIMQNRGMKLLFCIDEKNDID